MASPNRPLGEAGTKVLLDNDRVHIWELALGPGESSDWHQHVTATLELRRWPAMAAKGSHTYLRAAGGKSALELIAKHLGMFVDHKEPTPDPRRLG